MSGRVAVVDAADRFLRWETRQVVHRDHLFHRSIHVLVRDHQDRLVVQRRHRQKLTHAGYWDISCSGHVEEQDYPGAPDAALDQVYAAVARRELQEELGISVDVEELGHFPPLAGVHYEQARLFRARSDGPFRLQEEEVEEVRQVTLEALLTLHPLTPTLRLFAALARERGWW